MAMETKKSAKALIQNAVLTYMNQKPLEKITVVEVCKSIGISRSTFYLYYSDCFQVWESIQQHFCDQLIDIMSRLEGSPDQKSMLTIHRAVLDLIQENQQVSAILLHTRIQSPAFERVLSYAKELARKNLKGRTRLDEKSLEVVLTFIVYGDLACMRYLAGGGGKRNDFEDGALDQLLLDLISHGTDYFVDDGH